jgi:hypothetical protein
MNMLRKLVRPVKTLVDPAPRDIANMIRYGRKGPIAHERIWIDPRKVRRVVAPHPVDLGIGPDSPDFKDLRKQRARAKTLAGRLIGDEFDAFQLLPLDSLLKISACRRHWQEGLPWEETGMISALMFKITVTDSAQDKCHTKEDVVRRYQRLDEIFETVRAEGCLTSFARRQAGFRREPDGVQIHLGPDGELLFGSRGTHRFAMALVLGFERIPASLGFVHESALDLLPGLRRADPGAPFGSAGGSAGAGMALRRQ